jgi:LmbE family N-acetylglucosaminyl deacetylase
MSDVDADQAPDAWEEPQHLLIMLAHPDDPEFFCGASIARWTAAGHRVSYCLLTCGDKGTKDLTLRPTELCQMRQAEQIAAAAVLGVTEVRFLGYPDGYLSPDLNLRRDCVRVIRQERPDIVVTCDPATLFFSDTSINHPDHRAAGQVVIDAIFPAARDHLYFPDLWLEEKLAPHIVREVWVSLTLTPNVVLDVTDCWETKIQALYEHKSQIADPAALAARLRARRLPDSPPETPRYVERFRRIVLG